MRLVYFRSPFFLQEDRVGVQAERWLGEHRFQCITLKKMFLSLDRWGEGPLFPCGACRRLLLERAARLMRRLGADLVVTGEVVGRGGVGEEELLKIDRALGLAGCVLRPLSALRLPPTRAEEAGQVDRSSFVDLEDGVSREELLTIARAHGVRWEGEGRECLFSQPGFVPRLLAFDSRTRLTENHIQLLQFEHCYVVDDRALVVVAGTPEEQARLHPLFLPSDVRLYVQVPRSPLALVRARWTELSPEVRAGLIAHAAERMAGVAGFPRGLGWTIRVRCEWEGETRQMRLPVEDRLVPTLISP